MKGLTLCQKLCIILNSADEQVSDILKSYTDGKITKANAKQDISKVDNLNLIDIDENNIDDVLYFAMEDAKASILTKGSSLNLKFKW